MRHSTERVRGLARTLFIYLFFFFLQVQMLSSHDLVEKAFGYGANSSSTSDLQKLIRFTEQLVTDLERLRDGMAPSLAALQGGGNDLLCMWSLLTLRALCANVGFRKVLLSSHSSVCLNP